MALNEPVVKMHFNTILLVFTFIKYTEAQNIYIYIYTDYLKIIFHLGY